MVKEEPYDAYKQEVMDAFPEDITKDSIKLSKEIPKQTLCRWEVRGEPQKIRIVVDTKDAGQTMRVGILTSAHKRIYIETDAAVEQLFETSGKDVIQSVFIENMKEAAITVTGIATIQK